MTENDPVPADPSLNDDDLDVEGHGLKEMAAGLSTAAILASGAAGVMHTAQGGSAGGSVKAGPASISVQADPSQAGDTSAPVVDRGARATVTTVGRAVTGVVAGASSLGSDPMGAVDQVVDQTIDQTRDARDAVLAQAQQDAAAAEAAAQAAGRQTQHDADRAMAQGQTQASATRNSAQAAGAGVQQLALTTLHATVQEAQAAADAARTIVVNITKAAGGGSVDASGAGGTVTVSVNGVVVATATVKDGQATIRVTGPGTGGQGLTISYHGDQQHAPSTLTV